MNLFAGQFGQGCYVLGDARALSKAELQELAVRQAPLMRNATRRLDQFYVAMNYRPPVFVPAGWAAWYQWGDELI